MFDTKRGRKTVALGLLALAVIILAAPVAHAATQAYYTAGDKSIDGSVIDELERERLAIGAGFEAVDDAIKEGTGTGVGYTPTTGANWADPDPTTMRGGLDALAAVLAGTGVGVLYTPTTGADWIGTDPTTMRGALDTLAALLRPAKRGTTTLSGGTVTVTAAITASSLIFVTRRTAGGTLGTGGLHTPSASRNVGSGTFVIEAIAVNGTLSNGDTSTVDWWVID